MRKQPAIHIPSTQPWRLTQPWVWMKMLDLQLIMHQLPTLGTEFILNFSSMAALNRESIDLSMPLHSPRAVHPPLLAREEGRRRVNTSPPFRHHIYMCSLRKGNAASG